jgi:hypothetical protein
MLPAVARLRRRLRGFTELREATFGLIGSRSESGFAGLGLSQARFGGYAASMDVKNPTPTPVAAYERPAFEVIPLDCEITAYAPDGEDPLF